MSKVARVPNTQAPCGKKVEVRHGMLLKMQPPVRVDDCYYSMKQGLSWRKRVRWALEAINGLQSSEKMAQRIGFSWVTRCIMWENHMSMRGPDIPNGVMILLHIHPLLAYFYGSRTVWCQLKPNGSKPIPFFGRKKERLVKPCGWNQDVASHGQIPKTLLVNGLVDCLALWKQEVCSKIMEHSSKVRTNGLLVFGKMAQRTGFRSVT